MPLVISPRFVAVNSAGVPYPSAKLYTYKAGTLIALSTYTSESFGVPLSNPIVADANGLFPAIYLNPSLGFDLRMILKTSADVQIWDEDNIPRSQTFFSSIVTLSSLSAGSAIINGSLLANPILIQGLAPYLEFFENDAAVDSRRFHIYQDNGIFGITTKTDAGASGKDVFIATHGSGTAISSIALGNATDLPTYTLNGMADWLDGSFIGTLTGMTGATTGTFYYRKRGHLTSIHARTAAFGTSNTTAFTLTGIPTSIMPSNVSTYPFIVHCLNVLDNSLSVAGTAQSLTTSSITFGTGTTGAVNNFTAANGKGMSAGWNITFPVMG